MLEHKTRLNLYLLLAFFLTLTACDMFGGDNNDNDNSPPNASVTADKKKPAAGDTVALDASESSDPDGDELTFSWTLETPDGSNTALSAQTAVDPQFIPDTSGNYTARVRVDDGSLTDTDDLSLVAEEDEPDSVTVKTNLSTTDNGTLANCVVEFTPESGDTVRKQSCNGPSATFPKDSGTVAVHATADDYQQMEKTTSTESDRTLEFTLEPETPDQSTVTFAVTEADTLVAAEIFVADTLAADGVEPTAVFPYDQTINARVESEFLETAQISFTTDKEEKTVTVTLQRKSAEIAITPRDDEGNLLADAKTVIREPNSTDSTTVTGDSSVELLQLPGQREIETRLITDRSDDPDRLIRYKPFSTTVSASEDAELTPKMARLPACDDSIDNDPNDDLVDMWVDTDGNSIASPGDEGDPGCSDTEDDNEGHRIITRETQSLNRTYTVSDKKDDRSEVLIDRSNVNPLDESVHDAIANILLSREAERDTSESGEEFALRLDTGPENELGNVNTTRVIPDRDTTDGWQTFYFAFPSDWFATGEYYTITGVHGTKVRGKPPGDGGGEVVFLREDGKYRVTLLSWAVEEEDFDGFENSAGKYSAHQEDGRDCTAQQGGICRSAKSSGYPNW